MTAEVVDTTTGEILGAASPTPYQLLPRLTDDEYDALKADIAEHGIRVPIDVDENGTVIDGHHRAWIAADLNIDCPRRVLSGLTDEDKRAHAVAVNIHRRNLSRDQRRDLVRRLREQGMSTRRIADAAQVPARTVANDLGSPVPNGTPDPSPVVGADGKTYANRSVLDERKENVGALLDEGFTAPQIADALDLPLSTVKHVIRAVKGTAPPATRSTSPADTPRKVARIRELAGKAWTSPQIARDLGVDEKWVRQLARDNGVEIHADKVMARSRRIDSVQVAAEIVASVEALALPMRLVNFTELEPTQAAEWANSLTESIRALNRFVKQMKELAQ